MYSKEKQLQCQGKNGGIKTGFALYEPNPDNQELKIFVARKKVLPQKAQNSQLRNSLGQIKEKWHHL